MKVKKHKKDGEESSKLCSHTNDEVNKLYSYSNDDTCGVCGEIEKL